MIQVMRDSPALLKSAFGMRVHLEALKKVKGSEWEAVLFPESRKLIDKELDDFHEDDILFSECIEETQKMLELREVPSDINYAIRMRIKDIKEMISATKVEDRMPLLKTLTELHRAVFHNKQLMGDAQEAIETDPEPAA